MPTPTIEPADPMKRLSTEILALEGLVNSLEQTQLDALGSGDPVLNDGQLAELNKRQGNILALKNTLRKKTAELARMKNSYYKNICRHINSGKRNSRKLVIREYGDKYQ